MIENAKRNFEPNLEESAAESDRHGRTCEATPSTSDVGSFPDAELSAVIGRILGELRSAVGGGTHVGRFRIEAELGVGGYGTVFLAFDTGLLQRRVAIKVLHESFITSSLELERFIFEARTAASLQHEHIVGVYEIGDGEDFERSPFIVFEYVPGTNLAVLLKEQSADGKLLFESQATLRPFIENLANIADAVQYAHDQGVIHRDLKPSNILVDRSGRWRVTDFGMAWGPSAWGTPEYAAPEQNQRVASQVSRASDVYGLGAILYKLCTGAAPGMKSSAHLASDRDAGNCKLPRQHNPNVPKDIELICMRALAESPMNRYPSAGELADDLRRWLKQEPISIRRSPIYRVVKLVRRNWEVSLGIVGVLVAILVGLVTTSFWYLEAADRAHENEGLVTSLQASLVVEKEALKSEKLALAEKDSALGERQAAIAKATVTLANSQMQRGRWLEAIRSLELAEEQGYSETNQLRIETARCHLSLDDAKSATAILALLDDIELPAEQRSVVLLLRGDIELGRNNAKAVKLVRAAVELGLTSPVDQAYAEALIAPTVTESLQAMNRALELDPAHHRANLLTALTYLITGQNSNVEEQLARATAFYPDDPLFLLIEMLLPRRPTPERADEIKNRVLAVHGPEAYKQFEATAEILHSAYDVLSQMLSGNDVADTPLFIELVRCISAMSKVPFREERWRLAISPQIESSYGRLFRAALWPVRQNENIAKACQLAVKEHNDAVFHLFIGERLFEESGFMRLDRNPGANEANLRLCQQAIDELTLAAELPSGFPCRLMAIKFRFCARVGLWVQTGRTDNSMLQAAAQDVKLLFEGKQPFLPLRPEFASHELNLYFYIAHNAGDQLTARKVIHVWETRLPNDTLLQFNIGQSRFQRGEKLAAIDAFQRLIDKANSNPAYKDQVSTAQERLQKAVSDLAAEGIHLTFDNVDSVGDASLQSPQSAP